MLCKHVANKVVVPRNRGPSNALSCGRFLVHPASSRFELESLPPRPFGAHQHDLNLFACTYAPLRRLEYLLDRAFSSMKISCRTLRNILIAFCESRSILCRRAL